MRTFESVWAKLDEKGPEYRNGFVAAQVKRLLPFQINAMRKNRGWSQEQLAKRSGLTQGVISRAEDPDYGNLTLNTAISIAGGFDVAFIAKFVPFSELGEDVVELSQASAGSVLSFQQENQSIAANLGRIGEQINGVPETSELGELGSLWRADVESDRLQDCLRAAKQDVVQLVEQGI